MSSLREEVRVVPAGAWVIAFCIYACMAVLMLAVPLHDDPKLMTWPWTLKWLFALGVGLPLFVLVLLIGYVNGDARRRGMRYVMWTLIAALVPNAIGIVIYFILREPYAPPCPKCGRPVKAGYTFCPSCGAALAPACPQCRSAVEPGWTHCAKCGAVLPPHAL